MDKQLARITLNAAMQATRELASLPPLLKEHATEEVQSKFKLPLGRAVYAIRLEIMDPIFEMFPDLKAEFDSNVERFGVAC